MTLIEMRNKSKLTLAQVSQMTGIASVHLSRLEHGHCDLGKVGLRKAKLLADALGVSLIELAGAIEEET